MEISYNWLSSYLPETIAIDDLSQILTNIGLEVEGYEIAEAIPGSLKGLVIGEVLTCVPHPNADKLRITTVHVGNDTILPIVCGAPNVAAGQKVIVATVGTTVHPTNGEPFEIKKAKIRGEASEGMICADDEIGLGTSHDGIKVLPEDVVVGTLAADYFDIPAPDYTISIGLTPNRSDANSHLGVARDVCAYQTHHLGTKWEVVYPTIEKISATAALPIHINIEAKEAAPRYAGVTMTGIQVGPSPEWLQLRLQAIGVRSINNVVDITNYVLHEYGQPLHAFDYNTISNQTIHVKFLQDGTKFITLDEKERTLQGTDLMICDAHDGLCMAGVFGGTKSGVNENTTSIFLESAYFDPKTIRRTSLHHGLRTDAATHFEKSVDINMVIPALERAISLIATYAGGQVASDIIDIYPTPLAEKEITVGYYFINRLCGKTFTAEAVKTILTALGFVIKHETNDELTVIVPSDKNDVHQAADLVEEILRIDGLDNVQIPTDLNISLTTRKNPVSRRWKEKMAQYLTGIGMNEIITNSIVNSKYYPERTDLVRMLNSLTTELDVMRPELLESGLEVINYNANRKQQDLKLYEIGNTYTQQEVGKYVQTSKLGIWITGNITTTSWQGKAVKNNIYYLKGVVEGVLCACGVTKYQVEIINDAITYKRGRDIIATISAVSKAKLKAFDIKQDVYFAEIDVMQVVHIAEKNTTKYKPLAKFPAVNRDLAVVINKSISYQEVIAVLQKQKFTSLTAYSLFDIFESEKIGHENKSLALSFTFQLDDRTLTDEEVEGMMTKLIAAYQKDLNATIRS